MIKEVRKLIPAMALFLSATAANAQTAVTTAGGEAGTLSYTVGQPFYEAATTDAGSLTPGVQQAYVITTVEVGVPETAASLTLEAYPNPTPDNLTLRCEANAALRYTLTDANGRTLLAGDTNSDLTTIGMSQFTPGIYLLRVDDGNVMVKTFRIVKN